jgi:hypothetical protein
MGLCYIADRSSSSRKKCIPDNFFNGNRLERQKTGDSPSSAPKTLTAIRRGSATVRNLQ